jgi:Zn-dependent M28 family amino/carboxypeptidase
MLRLPVSLAGLLIAYSLSAAAPAAAPAPASVPAAERKGLASLTESALRTDLQYLASDKLAGRMSLQRGDDEAIHWISDQFAGAGLKPAGEPGGNSGPEGKPGWLQSFELIEYRPDRAATVITLTRSGVQTAWHAPEAFGAYKHAVDLTAPVVFAGFGITAPELGYDDYKGLNARGKIVLVFDHEPQEDDPRSIFNGTGNTRYATTRVKLLNAQAHGAVAMVVVAEPNRKHLTNAERAARIGGSITRTVPLPLQAIANDEVHIPAALVLDKVAASLLATTGTTGSALQSAIDANLAPQSRELPDTTLTLHYRNTTERSGTTSNVAGLLEGSDPSLGAETILISAHHDHDGAAPCSPDPDSAGSTAAAQGGIDENGKPTPPAPGCLQVWHGADDNGSGTVGVVELAKAFAANGVRPRRSILFVVFASEERGLLGSYWMAAHPVRPLATTRAMINFDMIGRDEKASPQTDGLIQIPADTTHRLNLIGALYSPDYDRVVHEEDKRVGLVLDDRFDHESALNVFFRSDQFPFVLHDVPAFWWFTGFHPDYHHITDTAEKIDYAKMRDILELAYLSAWRFADDATPPAFVANPMPSGVAVHGAKH